MLEINNLSVKYENIKAVSNVSFRMEEQACIAIVGANGAGKSTLLKSIMGLKETSNGKILFKNRDITKLPIHKRANLGMSFVPEGARVFPKISVTGNLSLGAYSEKNKSEIKSRLEYVYSLFPRLKERQSQAAGTLSGGERQMLAMARALMGKPELLMIDEISLGLMPKLVDTVFDIVDKLHKDGMTILLSEQNAHKAAEVAEKIYILELGSIIKESTPEGLLEDDEIRKAYLGR